MTHLFSEEEWNDYIDGRIDDEARDRIEAHIIGCLSCWEFYERMATATRALTACGAGLRAAFALQDRRLDPGARARFAENNEEEAAERGRPPLPLSQK